MPVKHDIALKGKGTRFKLFAQNPVLEAFKKPEIVWVSPLPGQVSAGPADERMYVVDPKEDKKPYDFPDMPPYQGAVYSPVPPDSQGHFDYLDESTREFRAAHMYGTLRRVLDIWEAYFGGRIEWHFRADYPRLELIPYLEWDNAQAGYGFLETGYGQDKEGDKEPFCLNFDVLAHELGHMMIYSKVGIPQETTLTAAYVGFQESCADLVALVSVLHFDSFVKHLLESTQGNLYALNELNRIGELSKTEQIRIASNADKMSDLPSITTPLNQLNHVQQHQMAQPLTGAIFDVLVYLFHDLLLTKGLISKELADMSRRATDNNVDTAEIQERFTSAYQNHQQGFKEALLTARDQVGQCLAATWSSLSPHHLSYRKVAATFLSVDRHLNGWQYQSEIRDCFLWRQIGYGFNND
jgi:hypothetical protein